MTKVGYGSPPEHSRWQKGQSGNPKGRPKWHRNLKTDLLDVLAEAILVHENGKTKRISRQRAMLMALATRAIKGDNRAAQSILALAQRVLDPDEVQQTGQSLSPEDQELIDSFVERKPPVSGEEA